MACNVAYRKVRKDQPTIDVLHQCSNEHRYWTKLRIDTLEFPAFLQMTGRMNFGWKGMQDLEERSFVRGLE